MTALPVRTPSTRVFGIMGLCLTAVVVAWCVATSRPLADPKPADSVRGRQLIVAVDLSGSRSDDQLKIDRHLVDSIIDGLESGDQLVIIQVDEQNHPKPSAGLVNVVPVVKDPKHPSKSEQQRMRDAREDMRGDAALIFRHRPGAKTGGTNLFATLFSVADYVHESDGRRPVLVMLSDMIQQAQKINFARPGGVPADEWIKQQLKMDLLPKLDRMCVSVVGADPSTPDGVKIRTFWTSYFKAAGADFSTDRYRLTVSDSQNLGCEPVESHVP